MVDHYDVIVLGGGAAGLMCAARAGQRGRSVLLLENANKLGKKILMSGGGRCNFTNKDVQADNFICSNPHFVKSALSRYSQWDFINLVEQYDIPYFEKKLGQLFCENSAKDILAMLVSECDKGAVQRLLDCQVDDVQSLSDKEQGDNQVYNLATSKGHFTCSSLIVATGGLSIPSMGGATGFGYDLAKQFGLKVNAMQASLVPFTLSGQLHELSTALAGVALEVSVSVPNKQFVENMLFTHRGLSGPAMLQISNYWDLGENIVIDLLPNTALYDELLSLKKNQPNVLLLQQLNHYFPKSLVQQLLVQWLNELPLSEPIEKISLHNMSNKHLEYFANRCHNWQLKPSGTEGYRTAEVTRGGVCVSAISSKTMQSNSHQGLYFIGEVLDVTGHLGGYNFQWAWSSAVAAGESV